MKNISEKIENVYFVGIGGIGMSALARYFKANGYRVAGYDRTPSPLTEKLSGEEGIPVNYRDSEEEIGAEFRDKARTLVVYTPAIPQDNASAFTNVRRCWGCCRAGARRCVLPGRTGKRRRRRFWHICCIVHRWDAMLF